MIQVTIELAPYGDVNNKSTLSEFQIVNTGRTKNPDTYIVRKNQDGSPLVLFKHYRDGGLHLCVEKAINELRMAGLDKL